MYIYLSTTVFSPCPIYFNMPQHEMGKYSGLCIRKEEGQGSQRVPGVRLRDSVGWGHLLPLLARDEGPLIPIPCIGIRGPSYNV